MKRQRLYLFYVGHPAHYYTSRVLADRLAADGNSILFVARAKDVLLNLLKDLPYELIILSKKERGVSAVSLLSAISLRELKLFRIAMKFKPDIMIGTDMVITHVGKLLGIPAFIINDDDEAVVPLLAKYGFKYSTATISPVTCHFEQFADKKVEYDGFHKMIYLNPDYYNKRFDNFTPELKLSNPYFIVRLAKLSAHHDSGAKGISDELVKQIIKLLEPKGTVYVSSEREISPELEQYKLKIEPSHMHYYLSNADLLISDSQSMSVEAAMLGVPSIRYNSFVGKIGVLNELEEKYGLTFGIEEGDSSKLLEKIESVISTPDLKEKFRKLRMNMFEDKINVTEFFYWLISGYPESLEAVKNDPRYYEKFKDR